MDDNFYIDKAEFGGYYLIRDRAGKFYTAGKDKDKVVNLIERLNKAHRPNVKQGDMHEVSVCWNTHEKGERCNYELEIYSETYGEE